MSFHLRNFGVFVIALIQRVTHAKVEIAERNIGEIQKGILALVGIEKTDSEKNAERLLEKILSYRIFNDENGKMNLSTRDVSGGLLLVSQFTLVADTNSGTRPSFSTAMPPNESKQIFEFLVQKAISIHQPFARGEFGAHMQITLCNDGPVTFLLNS